MIEQILVSIGQFLGGVGVGGWGSVYICRREWVYGVGGWVCGNMCVCREEWVYGVYVGRSGCMVCMCVFASS